MRLQPVVVDLHSRSNLKQILQKCPLFRGHFYMFYMSRFFAAYIHAIVSKID